MQQWDQNWSYWISCSVIVLIAFRHVRTNLPAFLKIILRLQGTRPWPLLAVPLRKEPTLQLGVQPGKPREGLWKPSLGIRLAKGTCEEQRKFYLAFI